MIRFFNNIPIFRRFFGLFTIIAIVPIIVLVILSNFFLASLNIRSQAVQTSVDSQSISSQELGNLQRLDEELRTRFNQIFASLSGKVSDTALTYSGGLVRQDIENREAEFGQTLQTYQEEYNLTTSSNMSSIHSILVNDNSAVGPGIITDQKQALDLVVMTQWPAYETLLKQEIKLLDLLDPTVTGQISTISTTDLNTSFTQAYRILWQSSQSFTDLQNTWQRVVDDAATTSKTVTTVGQSEVQPILLGTFIAAIGIIIIASLIGLVVNFTIVNPLRSLAALTKNIARGDTSARAHMSGRDEITVVAESMNRMLDNIVYLIQEAQGQRDLLQQQVEKLVSEVSNVGEGDLRVQAEVTTDALGVLADSFNYMVEELGNLIVRVKNVANQVEGTTSAMFGRLGLLVERGDTQLKQLSTAVGEVEQMAGASRQVADRAGTLFEVAHQARERAHKGRQAVSMAIGGMGRIHDNVQETASKVHILRERSSEIQGIVEVISAVAHQTNRLALDAAIQSAMAGEGGKGFGAVAADIRRLAERTKEQTTVIGRIVRDVRDDIEAVGGSMQDTERETAGGSELTKEAGIALEAIFAAVEQQAREIENINRMAGQQLQSSKNVLQIVQQVSSSTQQSTVSTRDTAQEMERLARLVEQLRASVEAFKLHEENQDPYALLSSTEAADDVFDQRNHMSLSGVFRKVTAGAQRDNGTGYPALTPPDRERLPQQFQSSPREQYHSLTPPPQWPGRLPDTPTFLPPQQQRSPRLRPYQDTSSDGSTNSR